ncbi:MULTISPECIES: ABC transporter ATP-binding protein [Paracoccus]|uniref:ABC transporter ATP-binding protein n=1 Tax=Paracoccus TaxID=265 RepID=UPI000914EC0F|nr:MULTISPECIES: ATP-binding cassette domain-containing protein [Paracoccus]MDF3904047.1 ATP-binding cassette domain-containing protein [Paracoccus sp. AS002]RDD71410.1 ABC transporter ATP-binding protein [Paracoccus versutus]WGR60658.1 ABC transporter ATP-binding protein [Paracoccus ferrooxidans]SFX90588.1 putative hydroxymethylpyrimidine transport system ATP-binding protein [Paracoccus pantotrophus]
MTAAASVRGRAWVGEAPLFAPVELVLELGGWTCLLGPSGVGKSTILRLIAGLETGARFEGEVVRNCPVALMAQDPGLIPWLDVTGNVTLGARLRGSLGASFVSKYPGGRRSGPIEGPLRRGAKPPAAPAARAAHLIEAVGLADRAHHLPANLSGGQRQRTALARTLFEDRPLVLLDEPFSALDARTRAQMQDLAARLLDDRTVLLVTHDPAEAARLGDRILLLRETGLTEWPRPDPRPKGAARPYDAPEVLALQAELMRGMMA